MTSVPTVRGDVDPAELGRTLAHEHVFVLTPDVQANHDEWDEEVRVADAVGKLNELAAAGYRTILDPTVIGLGRYLPRIERVAAQVDLNIVCATGVYTYDSVPFYFAFRGPVLGLDLPEPMVDMFVRDLTDAIPGSGVRAGFLKCAIDHHGMTDGVARILRAVARAHQLTGAPIMVHTHPDSRSGLEVHRLLTGEGVDPHRVMLAHSGDTGDVDHLVELADFGYLLGMDRFGLDTTRSFADRVATVAELLRRGYAGSMVLSQDAACYIDWIDPALAPANPNWNYLHVERDVLPALRAGGASAADIETMLVDNPRRYLAG